MISVEVISRGTRPPMSYRRVSAVVRAVLRRVKIRHAIVSVAFVSDATMRRLNRAYRSRDRVTDVLSFGDLRKPSADFPELIPNGEIVIALAEAKRKARRKQISLIREMMFLLVHGSLHLSGYDHERPNDAAKMLPLQDKIMVSLQR